MSKNRPNSTKICQPFKSSNTEGRGSILSVQKYPAVHYIHFGVALVYIKKSLPLFFFPISI